MTVKEFIKQLEQCNYRDDTVISFGVIDINCEWNEFKFKMIEECIDLKNGENNVDVILELSEDHKQQIASEVNSNLEDDLKEIIQKYCF
jgi:hypothetical protein